jgi:Uma2 family endonuclease
MTTAEFEQLPDKGSRYELVNGELVEKGGSPGMAGANVEHVNAGSNLQHYLSIYVRAHKLGKVYGSDARYNVTPPGTPPDKELVRLPDISFVQSSRVVRNILTMPFAPDLAVEVLSDTNAYREIENKVREYFGKGGQLVWVVDVPPQEVYVYRKGNRQRETFSLHETLSGEGVIPGFTLDVKLIFE